MKKHLKEIRSNNDGFTLLEVLVSMIILTIVCVPLFRSFATSAQTNARAKIQARCTTASENIMEKIRNMPTDDILTTFSGATASGVDIHFEIEDNATMNADLPDGYKAIVDLNPNVDPDGYDAYPNANSLNMADFSPISVRDCAIYTMPSGYDKEAYDWYEEKSTAFGTNKDWKYFRNELTRDIVFTIEDTGIPYTDDEGNTKNAIKVKMDIWYYCNASNIVDPITERKHVTSSVYLYDNTASHNDLSGIYLFYYPRYIASTGGGAIRKDVIEVNKFGCRPRLLRSGLGCLQHLVCVPALARAGVEEHRKWLVVHHWFLLFKHVNVVYDGPFPTGAPDCRPSSRRGRRRKPSGRRKANGLRRRSGRTRGAHLEPD